MVSRRGLGRPTHIGLKTNSKQLYSHSFDCSHPTTMASHDRTPSGESALALFSGEDDASFASNSSEISARPSEFLKEVANIIKNEQLSLSNLADRAEKMIPKLASHDRYNQLDSNTSKTTVNVRLDRILTSMLHYAEDCGGEKSKRYTAAAICACYLRDEEESLKYLQSLATTWLSHLLYVCKQTVSVLSRHNL